MVGNSARRDQFAVVSPQNSSEVFVQPWLSFRGDTRLAVFRAEHNVGMEACEGLWHGWLFRVSVALSGLGGVVGSRSVQGLSPLANDWRPSGTNGRQCPGNAGNGDTAL